jgi:uncharacterized damage-inducible protein DinB
LTAFTADAIRYHLGYNTWASQRLLEAAAALTPEQRGHDFGSAYKGIQGTLTHVFRSERTWLRRIDESAAPDLPSGPEDDDWEVLVARWPRVQQAWQNWAATLSDSDSNRVINYVDMKGNPWSNPVWHIVLHAVNHSTHHRGQVSAFLRATQIVPPSLDFIAFVRLNSLQ